MKGLQRASSHGS